MKSNIDQPIWQFQCYAIWITIYYFLNSTDMCFILGYEICSSVQSDGWQLIFSESFGSAISAQLP